MANECRLFPAHFVNVMSELGNTYCARQSLEEGEEGQTDLKQSETSYRDPPGASPEPVRIGHPPEPSVAWCGGDLACEAYTGGLQAV